MKKKILTVLSIVISSLLLFSTLSIFSFAEDTPSAEAGFDSAPYYLVANDWFVPSSDIDGYFPLSFTSSYQDGFMYWDTIYIATNEDGYQMYYISFSNDAQALVMSVDGDVVIYNDESLRYINVIGTPPSRSKTILDMLYLEGFNAGTYYFTQSPVFNRTTSFDITFSSPYWTNVDGNGTELVIYSINYHKTPSVVMHFAGTYVFSTSVGFLSGWDGKITFTNDVFLTDVTSYELLKTIFLPFAPSNVTDEELDKAYDDGYTAGQFNPTPEIREDIYDQGYGTGYGVGYTSGYNIGLNANGTAVFGENLLGQTIQVPFETLMNIQLFTLPNGNPYTIGSAFGSIVALVLFIVFLKLFAGG